MSCSAGPVVAIDHYGGPMPAAPAMARRASRPASTATGDAVDIAAFHLADGRTVSVARDWASAGPQGAFLHRVRDGACRVFNGVLSPDYNAAHRDHLHLDMGQWTHCG